MDSNLSYVIPSIESHPGVSVNDHRHDAIEPDRKIPWSRSIDHYRRPLAVFGNSGLVKRTKLLRPADWYIHEHCCVSFGLAGTVPLSRIVANTAVNSRTNMSVTSDSASSSARCANNSDFKSSELMTVRLGVVQALHESGSDADIAMKT